MRKLSVFLLCAAASAFAGDGAINVSERAYLLEILGSTQKTLIESIQGLSEAQWTFKPAPAVWSVQECAEHIIMSEDLIRDMAVKAAQGPAAARPTDSNPEKDRKIFESVQDRSKKGKAPEILQPGRKFATPADAVREFTAPRRPSM